MKKTLIMFSAAAVLIGAVLAAGCARDVDTVDPAVMPAGEPIDARPLNVKVDDCDDNNNANSWGGYWFSYNDNDYPNCGYSTVTPRKGASFFMHYVGEDINLYAARVYGWVITGPYPNAQDDKVYCNKPETDYPYPFIGMGTNLSAEESAIDLNDFTGIRFDIKRGLDDETGKFRFAIKSANNPNPSFYDYYGYIMTISDENKGKWITMDISFSSDDFKTSFIEDGYPKLDKEECLENAQALQWQTKNDQTGKNTETYGDFWIDNIYLYRE